MIFYATHIIIIIIIIMIMWSGSGELRGDHGPEPDREHVDRGRWPPAARPISHEQMMNWGTFGMWNRGTMARRANPARRDAKALFSQFPVSGV